jgi:hypothetical protein
MSAQHRSHRLGRLLTAGVTAVALAAPPAVARPIDDPQLLVRANPATTEQPPVMQQIDDGFDWGSAAIGAGGAGALIVLVSLGGYAYTSRNRIRIAR